MIFGRLIRFINKREVCLALNGREVQIAFPKRRINRKYDLYRYCCYPAFRLKNVNIWKNPLGIDVPKPRLSWKNGNNYQYAWPEADRLSNIGIKFRSSSGCKIVVIFGIVVV